MSTSRRNRPALAAVLAGALPLAAGLAAGLWLWREWGLLVFLNGGGLGCW